MRPSRRAYAFTGRSSLVSGYVITYPSGHISARGAEKPTGTWGSVHFTSAQTVLV